MIFLCSVTTKHSPGDRGDYPFNLPVVRQLDTLTFSTPVTFFVGENGTGKPTLLESIAAASGAITIGGRDIADDATLAPVRLLAQQLMLSWNKRTARGFFLRAEDFFNFAGRMNDLAQELDDLEMSYGDGELSYGTRLAKGAVRAERASLVRSYGSDLHARSHGEAFLQVFQSRFVPGGLYLLDEPDTALSPLRQLALLAMLNDMVQQQAQFIIATHAPMLLASPGATIYRFDEHGISETPYDAVDNVTLMRDFLANPDVFLRQL